jgi:hypothetical protein
LKILLSCFVVAFSFFVFVVWFWYASFGERDFVQFFYRKVVLMDKTPLTGKDLLLLLLYCPNLDGKLNGSISGCTRIIKMIWLF